MSFDIQRQFLGYLKHQVIGSMAMAASNSFGLEHSREDTNKKMSIPLAANATICATFFDEWAQLGLEAVFISPGSRSTPLALAAIANKDLRVELFHDERCAAFAALGHGLATGRAAAVLCTSGTAAAHFSAAVIEADMSCVPMLVLTADRPPELWGRGAPQVIDQLNMFAKYARVSAAVRPPEESNPRSWRAFARTVWGCVHVDSWPSEPGMRPVGQLATTSGFTGSRTEGQQEKTPQAPWRGLLLEELNFGSGLGPGPAHINMSFREPLVSLPDVLPKNLEPVEISDTNAQCQQRFGRSDMFQPEPANFDKEYFRPPRTVIVAGRTPTDPQVILQLAKNLGAPILCDHRSGLRGSKSDLIIDRYDTFLRNEATAEALRPEFVIRFGEVLSSKALSLWLSKMCDPAQLVMAQPTDSELAEAASHSERSAGPTRTTQEPTSAEAASLVPTSSEAPTPSTGSDAIASEATTQAIVATETETREASAPVEPSSEEPSSEEQNHQPVKTLSAIVASGMPFGKLVDPENIGDWFFDEPATAETLASTLGNPQAFSFTDAAWIEAWQQANNAAQEVVTACLSDDPLAEPSVVAAAVNALPTGGALVAASSMPVRDLEWYGPARNDISVFSNRGANGIDGTISTAIAIAAANKPTICVLGDVAFLHDSTSLIALAERSQRLDLTILVIDNNGGGIFSFLPQQRLLPNADYELLFGTPHSTDLAALTKAHGLDAVTIDSIQDLEAGLEPLLAPSGVKVVVVKSDRAENRAFHQQINNAY